MSNVIKMIITYMQYSSESSTLLQKIQIYQNNMFWISLSKSNNQRLRKGQNLAQWPWPFHKSLILWPLEWAKEHKLWQRQHGLNLFYIEHTVIHKKHPEVFVFLFFLLTLLQIHCIIKAL